MINIREEGLFAVRADAYVNPVNCEGVSGAGLAKEFATRFPEATQHYRKLCKDRQLRPGTPEMYQEENGPLIVFFPTKDRWRHASRLEWVDRGLKLLRYTLMDLAKSDDLPYRIGCPMLGCGLGGLPHTEVRSLVFKRMKALHGVHFMLMLNTRKEFKGLDIGK